MDLSLLTGPLLLGYLFNWGLFGVLTVQTYLYYIAFPHDNAKLKSVVFLAYTLEIGQLVGCTYETFRVFALGWGDLAELGRLGLSWLNISMMHTIITSLNQFFYGWRIRMLSGNNWLASVVVILSLIQTTFGLYMGLYARIHLKELAEVPVRLYFPSIFWIGSGSLCDIVITCSIFYYLRRAKASTHVQRTNNLLSRLVKLVVETGLLCATVATLGLVLFIASPHTLLYSIPALMASKLDSNSLVAVLNSRMQILGGRNDADPDDDMVILNGRDTLGLSSVIQRGSHSFKNDSNGIHVAIEMRQVTVSDADSPRSPPSPLPFKSRDVDQKDEFQ